VPARRGAPDAAAAADAPVAAAAPPKKKRSRRPIIIGVVAVLAVAGGAYWLYDRGFEDTDDAQIDATIANVSPRVSGTVKAVYVMDNQHVKAGDLLVELDTADLEVAVAQAKAAVAQAEALLVAEDPSVSMTETSNEAAQTSAKADLLSAQAAVSGAASDVQQLTAQLAQVEATDKNAQLDKDRTEKLFAQGAISSAEHDAKVTQADATHAAVEAVKQALASARDRVSQQQARIASAKARLGEVTANAPLQVETRKANVSVRRANLELARAQLKQAELNLSYARVLAPVPGIVGKKSIAVGDRVAPGQQILAISDIDEIWVTANFRETQLKRMHPGQPATIHVDAIDVDLKGKVSSVGGATGSRFSLLPPENASGNFVKVVQRVPVRIDLLPGQNVAGLRPGMSVEPRVSLR
ncbi:MAG TPA: HlyD family secretion protein, partial [Minicystis sp.]|nr:HlyD family secretion protein [Minicystis sp.]